jgi:lipopolysaccharide export system protein LptC
MSSPTADLPVADLPGLAAEDIERRRRLLQRWRRHSFLIGVLRKLLPATCLAIIVALGAWSAMSTLWRQDPKVTSNAEIRALNPNFQGSTSDGKPFLVSAPSAVRDNYDTQKETLDHPALTVGIGTPEWTKITADIGVYREDTRMLDLRGHVTLDDYKGNHLATEHALVDTLKNNVDGDTRITGSGPLGSIDAQTYALRDGGAYLQFRGRVKSVIQQGRPQPAAAPPAPGAGK